MDGRALVSANYTMHVRACVALMVGLNVLVNIRLYAAGNWVNVHTRTVASKT